LRLPQRFQFVGKLPRGAIIDDLVPPYPNSCFSFDGGPDEYSVWRHAMRPMSISAGYVYYEVDKEIQPQLIGRVQAAVLPWGRGSKFYSGDTRRWFTTAMAAARCAVDEWVAANDKWLCRDCLDALFGKFSQRAVKSTLKGASSR